LASQGDDNVILTEYSPQEADGSSREAMEECDPSWLRPGNL
jgi:hypothetical protein